MPTLWQQTNSELKMDQYKNFEEWFFEGEEFALRAEQFYNDLQTHRDTMMPDSKIKEWLEAAFEAGRASK
jgi:gamma-glutamylcysteine synthetase